MKNKKPLTYCNPLSIPDIPRGKDEWYKFERGMFSHENKPDCVKTPDYRSISDPTVFYYDNKWYLYPSYGMAFVSENFAEWKHHRTEPYCPKYSPHIVKWKDKFLLTAWFCPLYEADSPLGEFKEIGEFIDLNGNKFTPCDPGLFADDDGGLYLYAVDFGDTFCRIVGYKLDENNPVQVVEGPFVIVDMHPEIHPWERQGQHNQYTKYGWIEGPHLFKKNGRYYMIYAAPDTCDASYCNAVYYSDESPLRGFVCQNRNPLTRHDRGIVTGAGHGSVAEGPNGTLWAFYTIACPFLHCYERRIGMDLVDIDENGELYCPFGVTDTPQYAPGAITDPIKNGNSLNLYNLTGYVRPEASSNACGREPVFATDESNLSFWQPADDDKTPTLQCNFVGAFDVYSSRVFWRDIGLDYAKGVTPAPVKYIIEGYDGKTWFTLLDMSENTEDKNIDYREFPEAKRCLKVRLKILDHGKLKTGVIDFAVFGVTSEE